MRSVEDRKALTDGEDVDEERAWSSCEAELLICTFSKLDERVVVA